MKEILLIASGGLLAGAIAVIMHLNVQAAFAFGVILGTAAPLTGKHFEEGSCCGRDVESATPSLLLRAKKS